MAETFDLTQLLNPASLQTPEEPEREKPPGLDKIVHLSVHDLVPSKDNFYSVKQIEELKASIELYGVRQNLEVKPLGNGKYRILAGERRYRASLALVNEGKGKFEFVPCSVEDEPDELKERLLLILTNSTARELSDWEKIKQTEEARKIVEAIKERDDIPGSVRELVRSALGLTSGQIARYETISNNLSLDFKEEMQAGKVGVSAAYELSRLPEEEQAAAFEEYQQTGKVTVKAAQAKQPPKSDPPPPPAPVAPLTAPAAPPAPTPPPLGGTAPPELSAPDVPPLAPPDTGTTVTPPEKPQETRFQFFGRNPRKLARTLADGAFCPFYTLESRGAECISDRPTDCHECILTWLNGPISEG